ncbi:hypothetical protein M3194_24855 [Paenibacillus glycanilyticus]|uniref:hypothetical protein n=1 Tax=Paenibacillus glycanilyticus TaxID=126569 RepID=UPI00203A7539|nr:hypothetical protein [Paenibacillus glycanilyticus]MCM3630567.1 hypothetical protein [Paenibacillus glycanilyticus]
MNKNINIKTIKSTLIPISLILIICWYLFDTTTGERVTLLVAGSHNILIQDKDNHISEISISIDLSDLITERKKLFDIEYKERLFQRPRLISIKPVN